MVIQTRPLHCSEHKRCEDHAVMLSDRGFFGFETRLEWDDVLTRLTWWLSNLHLTFPIYLPTLSPLSLYLHDLQLYIPSGIIYAATHHIRSKQNYSPGHKTAGWLWALNSHSPFKHFDRVSYFPSKLQCMRESLWFQSKQCHLVCPIPGCQGDGNNICRNALLSPTMGSVFADLLLADGVTYRPLIGQTTAWHLGCWHEVCEVWITQIYRKHDTRDLEIRGQQRGQEYTLPQSSGEMSLSCEFEIFPGMRVQWLLIGA